MVREVGHIEASQMTDQDAFAGLRVSSLTPQHQGIARRTICSTVIGLSPAIGSPWRPDLQDHGAHPNERALCQRTG
jgi:hypothetical protein